MTNKYTNQHGFTLIELLAALTILGMVLITLIPFFSQHANFVRIAEDDLTAINLAAKIAEDVKDDAAPSYFVNVSCDNPSEIEWTQPEKINNKNYFIEIEVCRQADVPSLYQAKIEVYTDPPNQDRRLLTHVYTYMTKNRGGAS